MTTARVSSAEPRRLLRRRIHLRGVVQGVGFRPFVFRLAREMGVLGWVSNSPQGVAIEAQGDPDTLHRFADRLERDRPPLSVIHASESVDIEPISCQDFHIRSSSTQGGKAAVVLPDIASCPQCLQDIFDPHNRRYRYPFTNCTDCGPRYSIIESLPYDRANTTMRRFQMCDLCRAEYSDPLNRRFHAQPNACPVCGPHLRLWTERGGKIASEHDAIIQATTALRQGRIVALKGLGGFQLLVAAHDESVVEKLRLRKQRQHKPFALMFPSIDSVRTECDLSKLEHELLTSPAAPIVLLTRRQHGTAKSLIAPAVAPDNPLLGVMLPCTPLHHLLLRELDCPVVATSGNLAGEPICIDEHEALVRLGGIADAFLIHDRPIVRPLDDSVVRVMVGQGCVLRRARGYAPLPVKLPSAESCVLAAGAHLKNTVALSVEQNAVLSQHIGDLDTVQAFEALQNAASALQQLYDAAPEVVACDMHPHYASTRWAAGLGITTLPVQHHHAHIVSCMTEHALAGTVLGIAWDGTGFGPDGTIWGGEFLVASPSQFRRLGHLRPFRLPGGDRAVVEPRRSALGILFAIYGEKAFSMLDLAPLRAWTQAESKVIGRMLTRGLNAPITTSAGRLLDAVASLTDLVQKVSHEAQAAMQLEFELRGASGAESYPLGFSETSDDGETLVIDWEPMIRQVIADVSQRVPASRISLQVHNALVNAILRVALRAGLPRVVLSGGCFQNRYLLEHTVQVLQANAFEVYHHRLVPSNDGGLALGQAAVALARMQEIKPCA